MVRVSLRILSVALVLFLQSATAFRAPATPAPSAGRRRAPPPLALDPAREQLVKGGLPLKFAERVSFQSSGQRIPDQEKMILALWKEFKKCYKSEEVAREMLSKNTAVILPQLNSPAKIKGTWARRTNPHLFPRLPSVARPLRPPIWLLRYALLNKRLGKAKAADVVTKNPGVLVCSPDALAKETDESIIKAAELVATLDANKPIIRAIAGAVWFGIIGAVAYRINVVGAVPPGT